MFTAQKEACVFNIQRFSVNDGPGIRTTVFFKGCNLRCAWCHNPESISPLPQLEENVDKCIGCGACARVCPVGAHTMKEGLHSFDRSLCVGCGACADSCYAEALVMAGRTVTLEQVMKEIGEDAIYYKNSGGGVTFSGGECMLQLDFLRLCLRACREAGIHTAIDTAGNVPWSSFEAVLEDTDLFLYDLKAADKDLHKALTGVENTLILANLTKLAQSGAKVTLRIPVIPGCNDGEEELRAMASIAHGAGLEGVELMPYHRLGEGKYPSLGMSYRLAGTKAPSKEEMNKIKEIMKEYGLKAVVS